MRMPRIRRTRSRRGQRGLSLIEVLVAFFILLVVTLAVLQMISMAVLVNQTSEMRTELTYKAQQVIEQIRLQRAIDRANGTTSACCPLVETPGSYVNVTGDSGCIASYWGPAGANIIDLDARYEIRYSITTGAADSLQIVVEAIPGTAATFRYLGEVSGTTAGRVVRYVAEI